jgi:hypothetical protein
MGINLDSITTNHLLVITTIPLHVIVMADMVSHPGCTVSVQWH